MHSRRHRILYLALADARGHLMRAHVLRGVLAASGIDVRIATTSHEGAAFLRALGSDAHVVSSHFALAFNARHEFSPQATDRTLLRYLLDPRRMWTDRRALRALCADCDLVVNDSFHPALMLWPRGAPPVVQVAGENIIEATLGHFDGRWPTSLAGLYRAVMARLFGRAFGRITHALSQPTTRAMTDGRTFQLAPPVAALTRTREEVRAKLAIPAGQKLAAVYLNPHFRDPQIASRLEWALAQRGYAFCGVSEPYAARPGWRAADAHFNDVVAAADLYVSGAGMAALEQARLFGVPLLAIAGDQPEQSRNLAARAHQRAHPLATVSVRELEQLPLALGQLRAGPASRPEHDASAAIARVHAQWANAFLSLCEQAQKEHAHVERTPLRRPRPGDEQSARWRLGSGPGGGWRGDAGPAPSGADLPALRAS